MSVATSWRLAPLIAGALAALLAATGGLAAEVQVLELPAEIALDGASLTFDLAAAELAIEVRPVAAPTLRARLAKDDAASARLELEEGDDKMKLSRPAANGDPPRLLIEAVIAPGQQLQLTGRRLTVRIDALPPQPAADAPTAGSEAAAATEITWRLILEDSEADLVGLDSPVLDLTATDVWLAGGSGDLDLTLTGGSARVRDHRGKLKLVASDAEVAVQDHRGALTPRLDGGSLEVTGGHGNLDATAENALLRLDGWNGPLRLRGSDTTLEARAAPGPRAPWKIEGTGLQLALAEIAAPLTVNLDGGSFEGSGLSSKIVATAKNGTRLDLAELAAALQLTLTGAEARLSDLGGALKAELADAFLEADGVGLLTLTAERSRIAARRVGPVYKCEVTDSELDLDLESNAQKPSLKLSGTSRATVRLATPCLVQLQGPAAMVDRQVRLTGCDLLVPGQRMGGRKAILRYGDQPLTILRAEVSPDASLEVEGR